MKKCIYLWIQKYVPLDNSNQFLFENIGFNLSSEYLVTSDFKNKTLELKITKNPNFKKDFFSENISDIMAIIGANGTGKSTIFDFIRDCLCNGMNDVPDMINHVLLYLDENNEIQCRSTIPFKKLNVKAETETKKIETSYTNTNEYLYNGGTHKADLVIYYSPGLSRKMSRYNHGQYEGLCDISTDGLLALDDETLHNPKTSSQDDYPRHDRLVSYILMEKQRQINFAVDFQQEDFLSFSLPSLIQIRPSMDDIEYAMAEMSKSTSRISLRKYYNNLKSLDDHFRFAALMNDCRMHDNKFDVPENQNIDLKSELRSRNLQMSNHVEKMIEIYNTVATIQNGYVIFDLYKNGRELQEFYKHFSSILMLTPFLSFDWRNMSSGEESFLNFYSRLYSVFQGKQFQQRMSIRIEDIVMLIDEGDLYLHPEWQRQWLNKMIQGVEAILKKVYTFSNKPKIQIIMATHSPFLITDLPRDNVLLLERKNKGTTNVVITGNPFSFATNLFDVLKNGFFIKNSIGEFAENKIQELIKEIRDGKELSPELQYVFAQIGDPMLKSLIKGLLDSPRDAS